MCLAGVLEHNTVQDWLTLVTMTEEIQTGASHVIEVIDRFFILENRRAALEERMVIQMNNCTRENKKNTYLSDLSVDRAAWNWSLTLTCSSSRWEILINTLMKRSFAHHVSLKPAVSRPSLQILAPFLKASIAFTPLWTHFVTTDIFIFSRKDDGRSFCKETNHNDGDWSFIQPTRHQFRFRITQFFEALDRSHRGSERNEHVRQQVWSEKARAKN